MKKKLIYFGITLLVIIGIFSALGFYGYTVAKSFTPNISALQKLGDEIKTSFQNQDLVLAKSKTTELAKEVEVLNSKYKNYSWKC